VSDVAVTLSIPADQITVAAPLPEVLTQHNALAVVGVPPGQFLAMLRSPAFPLPVAKRGKLRLVERAPFVAWLLRAATPRATADLVGEDQQATVAARLGLTAALPAKSRRKG